MKKSYYWRKILDYLGVTFLLALVYFLWVLYQGPLGVPFLKPYIIKALNSQQSKYLMDIGTVNIELVRSIQPIKIIAKNVSVREKENNLTITTPKLFMSFSVRALLKGIIAPSSITVRNPKVSIFTTYGLEKDKENEINQKKVEFYFDWFDGFLARFNSQEKIYPESYINEIEIRDANIEFHEVDLGRKWKLSNVDFNFNRNLTNLELSAGGIVDLEERMATLKAGIKYIPLNQKLKLHFGFEDIVVSDFIKEIGKDVSGIDIPIEGNINAHINFSEILKNKHDLVHSLDKALEKIDFKISGSSGVIHFGDNEKFDYPIDSFLFEGIISGGLDSISLQRADLMSGDQKVSLDFQLLGYQKYFFKKSLEDLKINFSAKIDKLKMNELSKFWPRYFAEPAWEWCKESLYGGEYQNAFFDFSWQYDTKFHSLILSKLDGKSDIKGGTVFYLEGMPIVSDVYGHAIFKKGLIEIDIDKGLSEGVMVDSGKVKLYDLDKDNNFIDIKISGDSTVHDALQYINHPPLEFTKELGLDSSKIEGAVNIDLGLNFELYNDLKPEDIKVDVKALLTNVKVLDVLQDKDLEASKVDLIVNNKHLQASGKANFDNVPVLFDFTKAFNNKAFQSKGHFKFRFDESLKAKLGLKNGLLDNDYISGFADVTADLIIKNDQKAELDLSAEIENMNIEYAFLGFTKPVGKPGTAKAKLLFENKKLLRVPFFNLTQQDFSINGDVFLNAKGDIRKVNIKNISGPKTSASASIEFIEKPKEQIKINISGSSYDLTELFSRREKSQKEKLKTDPAFDTEDDLKSVPDTDILIDVGNLWTNEKTPIKNFSSHAILKNGIGIDEIHLSGNHGTDRSIRLTLEYLPKPNGEHMLHVDSNNAGSALRVLRLYDNMSGGILKIDAKVDKAQKMIGHAKIRDFKIHNTPLMAKLLAVASFSGILDLLKGDGLVFSHFDAPFSYKNKTLRISEAKMFGNVIGLTGTGTVNRLTENINIKGIMSPAYGLNSMVGKIPLVGKLLAGKDGTILAANYEIGQTINDPKISINPLSLLSPNSIKDLFSESPTYD